MLIFFYYRMEKSFRPAHCLLSKRSVPLFWGHVTVSLGFNERGSARGMWHLHQQDTLFNANKPVCILVGSCSNEGQNLQLLATLPWKRKGSVSHVRMSFCLTRNCKQGTRCSISCKFNVTVNEWTDFGKPPCPKYPCSYALIHWATDSGACGVKTWRGEPRWGSLEILINIRTNRQSTRKWSGRYESDRTLHLK